MPIASVAPLSCNAVLIGALVEMDDDDRPSSDVAAALTSALGSAMFGNSADSEQFEGYSKQVTDLVKAVCTAEIVTEDAVIKFYEDARTLSSSKCGEAVLRVKRKIEIQYSGRQIEVDRLFFCFLSSHVRAHFVNLFDFIKNKIKEVFFKTSFPK